MRKLSMLFIMGFVLFSIAACDPRNLGHDDDVFSFLMEKNEGLSAGDFQRASKHEIKTRFKKNWRSQKPNIQLLETTFDDVEGYYIISKSRDDFSGMKMNSQAIFKVHGINRNGTLDISLIDGRVCQEATKICSEISIAGGSAVMYLNDKHPERMGILINYKTLGLPIKAKGKLGKSSSYSGQSYWLFAGFLKAE